MSEKLPETERAAAATPPPPIRDVSDTALWVAAYRADESDRTDALFNDPYARRMAGERGKEIVDCLPYGRSMAWSMVVRTALMDEIILRCVERGVGTVLNLGAGLDTRAFRLPLPSSLRWLDVDLPNMTAYRRACLGNAKPACEHAHIAADLSDADARARVLNNACEGADPLLVVTEGLLVYLQPAQVSALARQLHAAPGAQWWLADLISPLLRGTMGMIWNRQLASADAPFQFAPSDSGRFFEALDWCEEEFHSTWTASFRLGRPAPQGTTLDRLFQWSGPITKQTLERMSGIALLRAR